MYFAERWTFKLSYRAVKVNLSTRRLETFLDM